MDDSPTETPPDPKSLLHRTHLRLTMAHARALTAADWSDPAIVAMHEKRARIIAAFQRNIEKTVVELDDLHLVSKQQDAADRAELKRMLHRLADRVERTDRPDGRRDGAERSGSVQA